MFLISFACSVAAITSPTSFRCGDHTHVQLAAVRPNARGSGLPNTLVAERLRCQGFDSKNAGELIATCRFQSGDDVACNLVTKGIAQEIPGKQRRYELPSCREREMMKR